MKRVVKMCKDCQEVFEMAGGEYNWYVRKGLHIPERCKPCRKRRKANV